MRVRTVTPPNNCSTSFLTRYESEVPVYKDFEVSYDLLRHRDVVFVGRPEANSALALWSAQLGLDYKGRRSRSMERCTHRNAKPLFSQRRIRSIAPAWCSLIAGNECSSTVKAQDTELTADQYIVFRDGDSPIRGFVDQTTSSVQRARSGN